MPRRATSLTLRAEEVASALVRAETSLARLRVDFDHLQTTLARLQGQEEIASFVAHTGTRGDVLRTVLGILRTANGGMELRDVTVRTMRELDMDAENRKFVAIMMEKVRISLLRQEKAGVVRTDRTTEATIWRIAL